MARKTAIFLGWAGSPAAREVETILAGALDLRHSQHLAFGDTIDQAALARLRADFLISFGPQLVRKELLDSVRIAAINLHTAPPEWPGRGSVSFALWNQDREFGVTAHLMAEEVDSGAILKVIRFPIAPADDVESLHEKTLQRIPTLARELLELLQENDWQPQPLAETWARKAMRQKDLRELMRIGPGAGAEEVERKVRAFAHAKKPGPFLELHGRKFWFLKNSD